MASLLADLPLASATSAPERIALRLRGDALTYATLGTIDRPGAHGLCALGLARQARVAVYLNKRFETVIACFAAARAGGIFVPVNPLLKAAQVAHILQDCAATVLITSPDRLRDLQHGVAIIAGAWSTSSSSVSDPPRVDPPSSPGTTLLAARDGAALHRVIDTDIAAILYTSGSTGQTEGRRAVAPQHGHRREERRRSTSATHRTTGCSRCCRSASITASAS